MRAKFKLSDVKDLEGLIYKLSEVGVSVADIYRQLAEGKEKKYRVLCGRRQGPSGKLCYKGVLPI